MVEIGTGAFQIMSEVKDVQIERMKEDGTWDSGR
jgi:hypothetical protein